MSPLCVRSVNKCQFGGTKIFHDLSSLYLREMGLKFRSICWSPDESQSATAVWEFSWRAITCSFYNQGYCQYPRGCLNQRTWNKMYLQAEDGSFWWRAGIRAKFDMWIRLKHLIPVSNCFSKRKTSVAVKVPLKYQMASSEFKLDPPSWLDDLSVKCSWNPLTLSPEGT